MIPLRDDNPTRRAPIVTIILIVINVVVFLYTNGLSARAQTLVFRDYGLIPLNVTANLNSSTALTFITSMFLHGGWLHIGGNMLFLWIFGNNIEDRLGKIRFILFYAVCGIIAGLAQIAIGPRSPYPQIGASGAIAGVLGGYIVLFPRAKVKTLIFIWYFIRIADISAVWVLGLWFVLQLVNGVSTLSPSAQSGVAFFAHIGGFVAGVVLIKIFGLGAGGSTSWYGSRPIDHTIPPIDQPHTPGKWWD
jgi:membrane associated rhomboid family serine protease